MDHIALLEAAVDRFEQQPVPKGGPALASFLERVQRVGDRIALKNSEAAAAFAGTNHYEDEGFVSPQHWMRVNLHMTGGASGDRIAVGDQLRNIPESHQSLLAGEIGYAHLAHIARTAVAIEESGTNRQFDETPLLEKARELPVGRFIDFCHHMRHAGDPVGYAAEEAQKVELRSLTLRKGEGGMVWVRGVLDPEGAAVFRTAIEALARRNGKGDDRKHERRFADAAVELAAHSLDNALVSQHNGVRPHLNVNTTLETLLRHAGAPAADLEFSLPISAEAVERLACDCSVTRILLGSDSAVIDVGRARRVVTPSQRRALKARDKGCRWPGCDRPATWSEGHHLDHWIRGGPSDLANFVLLCHRHHWMAHEGKWQVVKTDEGEILAIPPQLDIHQRYARGPDVEAAS
ncbi:MAG TPA: DUF222 domain-containing protein [Candidatus Eisenbacteria bacterium]|nr:DUF222 domain-containing protein [Candidatus Eisenbacteria bacterium]